MLWLTAGCVRETRSAARVNVPSSTTARKCSSWTRSILGSRFLFDSLVGGEGNTLGHFALRIHAHVHDAYCVAVGREDVGEHLCHLAALLVDDLVDPIADDPHGAGVGSRVAIQRLVLPVEHRVVAPL